MRASVFVGTSVDGFIARADGALDWLPQPADDAHGYNDFFNSVDAVVIGRHTFETVLAFDSWPYGQKPVIVLSRRAAELRAPKGSVCEFMSGEPREIWPQLERRGLNHLYIDGGITVQRFLDAGLVDRIIITRVPVLIGTGIPLFGPLSHDLELEHVQTRTLKGGMVQSEYAVVRT